MSAPPFTPDLAPTLAAALAARGYETLTAVQLAVLAPEAAGRDLLVSAQTGSGKTVAFGLAVAPEVLAGGNTPEATAPRALIVAPTRELALQVQREVEWLFAQTGFSVASCVGGMDFRSERRALERGATIVVGTPGRLRDHIERGSLMLGGLRAVVLDEADEMLDLGFREDLEFILGAAPEGRRTLMFSATVPKAIEELARDFQRDALRIVAKGEARQHGDIAYRALSVALRDKENAILNLLRLHDAGLAIVFCKTRAAVAHLAARMGNRGFAVVPLSGELGQQERTRALQSLRDGRARICVATDVAARGIDLPGLEMVVHADLPSNPDTLLHRSGRTGRAGAKGVSVLVVTPAEYRKAQRILQAAKVTADWGKPPTAAEVQAAEDARLLGSDVLSGPVAENEIALVDALLAERDAAQLAAAVVRMWRQGRTAPEVLHDEVDPPAASALPRPRPEFGASVWFSISVGHEGRAEARWLLPKVCEAGRIGRDSIGAIRVRQHETFVQVAADAADRLPAGTELEPGLRLMRLAHDPTAEDATGRPAGPPIGSRRQDGAEQHRAPATARPRADDAEPRPGTAVAQTPEKPAFTKVRGTEGGRATRGSDDDGRAQTRARPAPRPLWGEGSDPAARKPRPIDRPTRTLDKGAPDRPAGKPRWGGENTGPAGSDAARDTFAPRKPRRADEQDAPARKPRWGANAASGAHKPASTQGTGARPPRAPRPAWDNDRPARADGKGGKDRQPARDRLDDQRAPRKGGDAASRSWAKPRPAAGDEDRPARKPRAFGAPTGQPRGFGDDRPRPGPRRTEGTTPEATAPRKPRHGKATGSRPFAEPRSEDMPGARPRPRAAGGDRFGIGAEDRPKRFVRPPKPPKPDASDPSQSLRKPRAGAKPGTKFGAKPGIKPGIKPGAKPFGGPGGRPGPRSGPRTPR
jgi:ATP-dependent RNA helicase DeaD